MHRCLQLPEIQSAIVDTIWSIVDSTVCPSREDDQFTLQDLVTLAVTTHHFTDMALGALWKEKNDLAPLIKVMPSDLWTTMRLHKGEGKHKGNYGVILRMTRPVEENDWDRFDYYSSKIYTITLFTRFLNNLHESVYFQLCAYRPTRNLLPNLRSFTLYTEHTPIPSHIAYIPIFLGISLQEFRISAMCYFRSDTDTARIPHFLHAVSRACPFLRSISLPNLSQALLIPPDMFSLEQFIGRFEHIVSVSLTFEDCSPIVMRRLGLMPRLSHLDFSGDSMFSAPYPRFPLAWTTGGFHSLNSLELFAVTPAEFKNILLSLSRPLQKLTIHYEDDYSDVDLPTQWLNDLTHLTITYMESDTFKKPHHQTIRSHPLSSFFALNNLRVVRIGYGLERQFLTDSWLHDISLSWPQLEELHVSPMEDYTRMTLEGLLPVAQNCKKLVKLSIPVLCVPFNIESPKYAGVASQSLRSLKLHGSILDLERPWKVLRCIVAMFPKLMEAEGYPPDGSEPDVEGWRQLNKAFKDAFSLV